MTSDRSVAAPGKSARAPGSPAGRPSHELAVRGAELVAVAERFYGAAFVAALLLVGISALAALVLLPVRPFAPGAPVTAAAVAAGAIAAAVPLAARFSAPLYVALRRRPQLQAGLVLVAAALVAHPQLSSELWWPSCAIVMALATVAPALRALTYCVPVLCASLAGHVLGGRLGDTPAVAIVGLWIGFPMLVATAAVVTDRLVVHLMRSLSRAPAEERPSPPPRRVRASRPPRSSARPEPAAASVKSDRREALAPVVRERARPTAGDRLSARQLQVAVLHADGLRQREIAACLSISERQVQRHIADAVAVLGLRNAYDLAATVVAEGLADGGTPA